MKDTDLNLLYANKGLSKISACTFHVWTDSMRCQSVVVRAMTKETLFGLKDVKTGNCVIAILLLSTIIHFLCLFFWVHKQQTSALPAIRIADETQQSTHSTTNFFATQRKAIPWTITSCIIRTQPKPHACVASSIKHQASFFYSSIALAAISY